jgi:hypothetical protein
VGVEPHHRERWYAGEVMRDTNKDVGLRRGLLPDVRSAGSSWNSMVYVVMGVMSAYMSL